MRVFLVEPESFVPLSEPPAELPPSGFAWLAYTRREFELQHADLQAALQRWTGGGLVDLHVSDLLNNQLPSHFDYTTNYDLMVFRRLAAGAGSEALYVDEQHGTVRSAERALAMIDTSPVGFAVFDRVLVTVHPAECQVLEYFAQRLQQLAQGVATTATEGRSSARLPASPADLMLRMVNHMVDSYLELRRLMTRQLGYLQQELLNPAGRFDDWQMLLESRNKLHVLEDTCEDQRAAVQEWIDAMGEWPSPADAVAARERELMRLRSRDVLEHIERVLGHVRRLEQSAESSVQMHFSALGHRTNDIMRTLTVLTAIFLPLNLVTGVFGMNFEGEPLLKTPGGFWWATAAMTALGLGLAAFFWWKRYLGTHHRPR
jgi:Mg2+ and Co2+ transporter CorA